MQAIMKRSFQDEVDNVEDPLRSLNFTIWNLGERGTKLSLEEDIKNIADLLKEEHARHGDAVFETLWFCLFNLPFKCSLYVAALSLIIDDFELCAKLAQRLEIALGEVFAQPNEWRLGHVLRVWCECANNRLLPISELIPLLNRLVDSALAMFENGNAQRLTSFWIAKSVLSALPFAANILKAESGLIDRFGKLLDLIQTNLSFNAISPNDTMARSIFGLKAVFDQLAANGFNFDLNILNPDSAIETSTSDSIQIKVPSFDIPQELGASFNLLRAPLLLHQDAFEEKVSVFDQWLLYTWLQQVLDYFNLNHRKCAEYLFTSIPEDFGNASKIVQNLLFGELLRTHQHNPFHQIYIETLLVDACRFSKQFPPALARGLFALVASMDVISYRAVVRLADWFALHLSSFDFKWPWDEWKDAATWPATSMKRVFLQEAFEQLLRLTYYDRLSGVIPDYLKSLLPPQPKPTFAYAGSTAESPEMQFVAGMRTKQPTEELDLMLKECVHPQKALVQCVLFVGSKTISHASRLIERTLPLLKQHAASQEEQVKLQKQVAEFWRDHVQNYEITISLLLQYQVISKEAAWQHIRESITNSLKENLPFTHIMRMNIRPVIIDLLNDSIPQPLSFSAQDMFDGLVIDHEVQQSLSNIFSTIY